MCYIIHITHVISKNILSHGVLLLYLPNPPSLSLLTPAPILGNNYSR